jgi:hypothetical protein
MTHDYGSSMGQSRKEFDEAIDQERQKRVMKGHTIDSRFDSHSKGDKEASEPEEVRVVRPHEGAKSKFHSIAKEHINQGYRGVK